MSNPYEAPRAAIEDPYAAFHRTVPSSYWAFWKRGWWAFFMMTLLNVAMALMFLPLAFAFANKPIVYATACVLAALVIGIPLAGWLFEVFASGSWRITSLRRRSADAVRE